MDYLVYLLVFPENNMYIGLTNDKERRLREHKSTFKEPFYMEILHTGLTSQQACTLETTLIAKYREEYGSKLLNKADKGAAPTGVSGVQHKQSKLTQSEVSLLREVWTRTKGEVPLSNLAEEFNISVTSVHNVVQNKSYIDPNYTPIKAGVRKKKLTLEDVYAIRVEYRDSRPTQASLAKKYGITSQYLGRLVKGQYMPDAGGPILGRDY